jgi:hypothetical protein
MNTTMNATLNLFRLSWSPNPESSKVNLEEKVGLLTIIILLIVVIVLRYIIATRVLKGRMQRNAELEEAQSKENMLLE